jgi:hypothetical protein
MWFVSYFAHGERHACIGFDTEEEAFLDVEWLKSKCPPQHRPWERVEPAHVT